ncbi:MAG: hypothetical protein Q4B63_09825 [Clostridium perfringens]|nr:hypothetical protein [Clostridium perfringens]
MVKNNKSKKNSIDKKENVSTKHNEIESIDIKKRSKFSKEYKLGLYLAIGSIGAAYVWPILGFLLSIFGFVNSSRAMKAYKENKIPLILNIIAFIFCGVLLFITKANIISI